ncbi:hypothetical protein BJX62DRAFT_175810 [Aspergillus germanicus]
MTKTTGQEYDYYNVNTSLQVERTRDSWCASGLNFASPRYHCIVAVAAQVQSSSAIEKSMKDHSNIAVLEEIHMGGALVPFCLRPPFARPLFCCFSPRQYQEMPLSLSLPSTPLGNPHQIAVSVYFEWDILSSSIYPNDPTSISLTLTSTLYTTETQN